MKVLSRTVANELRAEAARKNLQLSQIADRAGLSVSTIFRTFHNRRSCKIDELNSICKAMEVPLIEIITRATSSDAASGCDSSVGGVAGASPSSSSSVYETKHVPAPFTVPLRPARPAGEDMNDHDKIMAALYGSPDGVLEHLADCDECPNLDAAALHLYNIDAAQAASADQAVSADQAAQANQEDTPATSTAPDTHPSDATRLADKE